MTEPETEAGRRLYEEMSESGWSSTATEMIAAIEAEARAGLDGEAERLRRIEKAAQAVVLAARKHTSEIVALNAALARQEAER